MPPLHPLIVHFPIALFIVAVLFDAITMFTRKSTLDVATRWLMLFSWLGAGAAILTGEWLKDSRGSFLPHGLIDTHQLLAFSFGAWITLLTLLRLRRRWRPTGGYISLATLGVILLVFVGHTGGEMAWPALPTAAKLPSNSTVALNGSEPANTSENGTNHSNQTPNSANATSLNTTTKDTTATTKSTTNTSTSTKKSTASSATTGSTKTSGSASATASTTKSGSTGTPAKTTTVNQVLYNDGARYFVNDCQTCHSLATSEQYFGSLTQSEWQQIVANMQYRAGGTISDTAANAIVYYFVHQK